MKAGQILLSNKTGKSVVLSLSFFHTDAQKEMKIREFALGSLEKTKFPQDKDLALANPMKLKVKRDDGVSVSLTFDKDDATVHDLEIVEQEGALKLVNKQPAQPVEQKTK
jgi:hypothetical protein